MQPLQLLVLACPSAYDSSQPRQVEISAGDFTKAMSILSSISTSMMMSTSSASPAEPLIDGRCSWDEDPGAKPAREKVSSATEAICAFPAHGAGEGSRWARSR